jgi:N-methylhydantoinase A
LIADYARDRANVLLVGGGGGAAALVPFAAQRLGFAHRIARDAHVISPLGVALALVRDVVERMIVDPSPADLARVRREAIDAAIASGAAPDRVEVVIEVDTARNRVRATASGATALVEGAHQLAVADETAQLGAAATHLRVRAEDARVVARTSGLVVIASARESAVVDARGVVRLLLPGAFAYAARVGGVDRSLATAIDEHTAYGDVGRSLPDVFLLRAGRIAEFTGLAEATQIAGLLHEELAGSDDDEPVVLLAVQKRA